MISIVNFPLGNGKNQNHVNQLEKYCIWAAYRPISLCTIVPTKTKTIIHITVNTNILGDPIILVYLLFIIILKRWAEYFKFFLKQSIIRIYKFVILNQISTDNYCLSGHLCFLLFQFFYINNCKSNITIEIFFKLLNENSS